MSDGLGISGRTARFFLRSELTPLLAIAGALLGVLAVLITPREEEPQIDVTFANVFVPFPGASAQEVESLVSTPAEQVLSEIEGIEHIYSVSRPGLAVLTVQFEVGEDRTAAIVRLYSKVFSNQDWLAPGIGVGQPVVKPKGIDDVPVLALTLWSDDPARGAYELAQVAHAVEVELKRVPGTRQVTTIGGPQRLVRVQLDPQRLAGYGIALDDLRRSLSAANVSRDAGQLVGDNRVTAVQAGTFLSEPDEVAALVVGVHDARPVFLGDVAEVGLGPDYPESPVWHGVGGGSGLLHPAVTVTVAKQPGANAVVLADALIGRFEQLRGILVPAGVEATVTRNYGVTADDKARTLITKLVFATAVVVLLVAFALGTVEAFIVGTAVALTLAVTLFASWVWGFTLNRVSLFALIFSIGILVDDAIVVVENIHRRLREGAHDLATAIPAAVDEVGGPTILATFTVIAALLPMAFVSGLMGPYMSPIPINASTGMLISLVVAFVVTPWMTYKVLGRRAAHAPSGPGIVARTVGRWLPAPDAEGFFTVLMRPFLRARRGRAARVLLLLALLVLIGVSLGLVGVKLVVLKMLPFDNKSEFQVVVDMPEGTPVEQTARVLQELGARVAQEPEVADYQVYAGTAAPINFNGLVRQYYLREAPHLGDLQVNLVDKRSRERQSHDIARALRAPLQALGERYGANVKMVEVPPGPPVMAPLVAEVYGPDYAGQIRVARAVRQVLAATPSVVDVDDSVEADVERLIVELDRDKAALLGVSQAAMSAAVAALLRGEDMGFLHDPHAKYAVPIRAELGVAGQADIEQVLAVRVRSSTGALVPLSEIVRVRRAPLEKTIYHKDLLPVVFVTGDVAGELDSPLYGMADAAGRIDEQLAHGVERVARQHFVSAPDDPATYALKWDGEWQVTYETFRDMGAAYGVGMLLIYLLVVAQFRSYKVPLVIMAPIPLTIIGVMPGHALLGAQFTATSMIGMIALAGIIVRNSILLVDFVNEEIARGAGLEQSVIRAAAVRAKPIVLTALAAMLGALFILDDPIFRGLAIALISGIFVATLLTLLVIPVVYYAIRYQRVA